MKQPSHDPYDDDWWYLESKDDTRPQKKLHFKDPPPEGRYREHRQRKPKQTRGRDE